MAIPEPMRTVGVDLAAQPKRTAVCVVEWTDRAKVTLLPGGDDETIVAAARHAVKVGIDAPFGWPGAFVDAVAGYHAGRPWPKDPGDPRRRALRYRVTDLEVHRVTGRFPLSVSTDLIGVAAMRAAALLDRLGVKDRSGTEIAVETYPAGALALWGLPSRGYKSGGRTRLRELVDAFLDAAHWLDVDDAAIGMLHDSHDAFDALVCACLARAVVLGNTLVPADADQHEAARVEGWVHLPSAGDLAASVGLA